MGRALGPFGAGGSRCKATAIAVCGAASDNSAGQATARVPRAVVDEPRGLDRRRSGGIVAFPREDVVKLTRPALLALALLMALHPGRAPGEDYDLVVANGRLVDGTGAPWFRGDLGVRGERIAAMGDLSGASAGRRIDAGGKVVAAAPAWVPPPESLANPAVLPAELDERHGDPTPASGSSAGPVLPLLRRHVGGRPPSTRRCPKA